MRNLINNIQDKIQDMVYGIVTVDYIEALDMVRIEIYTPNYTWSHDVHRLNLELDDNMCERIVDLYRANIISHFVK